MSRLIEYLEANKEQIQKGKPYFISPSHEGVSYLFRIFRNINEQEIKNAYQQNPKLVTSWVEYLKKAIDNAPKEFSEIKVNYTIKQEEIDLQKQLKINLLLERVDSFKKIIKEKLSNLDELKVIFQTEPSTIRSYNSSENKRRSVNAEYMTDESGEEMKPVKPNKNSPKKL